MAHIAEHLSVEELGRRARGRLRGAAPPSDRASGPEADGVGGAAVTGFVSRRLARLARRHKQFGPDALGNRPASDPEVLDYKCTRLETPPPDGGAWTTIKIDAFMSRERRALVTGAVVIPRAVSADDLLGLRQGLVPGQEFVDVLDGMIW